MRRALLLTVLPALVLAAGCGSSGDRVATDPATTSPAPASPTASPTARPTVGTYPAYAPDDYRYRLTVSCYCLGAGTPIDVTVVDGEVTTATYAVDGTGRAGVATGDPVPASSRLTIDDVIDAANDTEDADVQVVWPAGQDHPDSVRVDRIANAVDDEVGYTVAQVRVG